MNIRIKTEVLEKALAIVSHALPSKTVIESLKGIKIEAKNDKLVFSTSKQDLAISYTMKEDFELLENGICILPGKYFSNLIKKTYDEFVEIKSDSNVSHIISKSSVVDLVEYNHGEYPDITFEIGDGIKTNISKTTLRRGYNQTERSVSNDTSNPIITGINFTFTESGLNVASTDARRLSISKFNDQAFHSTSFTIHKNNLSEIIKIIDVIEGEDIPLVITKQQILIDAENISIKTRLLEGEYPEVARLIPTNVNYKFVAQSSDLKKTLDKILLLSEGDTANVKALIEDNKLVLESQFRELGSIKEKCDITNLEGTPFTICFDPKFLNESLSSLLSEQVEIKLVDEVSAFMVKDVDSEDNIHIISPYRTT